MLDDATTSSHNGVATSPYQFRFRFSDTQKEKPSTSTDNASAFDSPPLDCDSATIPPASGMDVPSSLANIPGIDVSGNIGEPALLVSVGVEFCEDLSKLGL